MAAILLKVSLLLGALSQAAPTVGPAPSARDPVVVAQFPNGTWVENLAVRSNGKILATILSPYAGVYQVDPCATGSPPQLVSNITAVSGLTGALGITEYEPDVFAVIVGNFSLKALKTQAKSNKLWKIDMKAFDAGAPAAQVSSKLADLPNAGTLNGLATSAPDGSILLATDCVAGSLFAIDTKAGSGRTVLNSTELQATNATRAPIAANGITILNRAAFVADTNTQNVLRIPLTPAGLPASSSVDVYGQVPNFIDDLALARDGTVFVATNTDNGLDAITPSGHATQVLGGLNSSQIIGGTSVRFGRTPDAISTLYMSTSGGIAAPLNGTFVQGGQVIAIKTDRKGV